jgi:CheY-like chemotaxis protein
VQKSDRLLLVVEDDIDLRITLEMVLAELGYRVITASDGQEALRSLAFRLPDLILLDMKMPVLDGWEFARRFRASYGRSIPIIVNTAAENAEARAKEIDADGFLGKPFRIDALQGIVEDTLARWDNNVLPLRKTAN